MVHSDPSAFMILHIDSGRVRLWVVSIPRGTAERIWFYVTEESKNEEMRIYARMVKVRRRFGA
jgi:hypothetical protein